MGFRAGQRSAAHLAVVVVDEDAAGAVVFEVGDLQAVGVSDLLGLEGGVDAVDLDYRFGLLRLQQRGREEGGSASRAKLEKSDLPQFLVSSAVLPVLPVLTGWLSDSGRKRVGSCWLSLCEHAHVQVLVYGYVCVCLQRGG